MLAKIHTFLLALYASVMWPWTYAKNVSAFNEYIESSLYFNRQYKFDYETNFDKFVSLDLEFFYEKAFKKYWFEIVFKPMSLRPKNVVLFAIFLTSLNKKDHDE